MMVDQAPSMERSPSADSAAPVAVWVRESSAEGYIEGVIVEWPNVSCIAYFFIFSCIQHEGLCLE